MVKERIAVFCRDYKDFQGFIAREHPKTMIKYNHPSVAIVNQTCYYVVLSSDDVDKVVGTQWDGYRITQLAYITGFSKEALEYVKLEIRISNIRKGKIL
jgi:hypothetical protein